MAHAIWIHALKAGWAQTSGPDLALGAAGFGLAGASLAFAGYMIANSDAGPRINSADRLAIFAQPAAAPYNGGGPRLSRAPEFDMTPVGTIRARTAGLPPAPAETIVTSYRMRGYSQGEALVQGPDGFINVKVGSDIRGLGQVIAIEARGRSLVIITTGGTIAGDD